MTERKILIAGAGLGGLAAAGCLLKAGYDVEIYEQAPVLGEVGAGIQMSANAMHVLNHLGVGDEISAKSVRPEAYVFRLHDTGELIDLIPELVPDAATRYRILVKNPLKLFDFAA